MQTSRCYRSTAAGKFDLIVGTSTGGIVALGLGAGLRPREILDFYPRARQRVFSDPLGLRSLRGLWWSKHSQRRLEAELRAAFGDRLLGESTVPLVIPSFDIGANSVHLFKTSHHPRLRHDHRLPMWQVAMATAAAPTFFPTFRLDGGQERLIDGGVWANNPTMVGISEAVSMFGRPLPEIKVLSLGTSADTQTRKRHARQAFVLKSRYPTAELTLGSGHFCCRLRLTPTPISLSYEVNITYRYLRVPTVRGLTPLTRFENRPLPHTYRDGTLCLDEAPDWNPWMLIADSIVPWTAEWLAYCELWNASGEWHGGGVWPPVQTDQTTKERS